MIEARGKVLDEIYIPLSCTAAELERPIERIKKLQPDVIFSTIVGAGTAMFYEALSACRLRPRPYAHRQPDDERGRGR